MIGQFTGVALNLRPTLALLSQFKFNFNSHLVYLVMYVSGALLLACQVEQWHIHTMTDYRFLKALYTVPFLLSHRRLCLRCSQSDADQAESRNVFSNRKVVEH